MFKDLLGQAYEAMRHDLRRTTLTMFGMAWGIATVVLLLAYGSGFGRAVDHIFQNWGAKVIGISDSTGGVTSESGIAFMSHRYRPAQFMRDPFAIWLNSNSSAA